MCRNSKKKNKDIEVECWNLDYYLLVWVNEHLKKYLEDAGKVVDLEKEKFRYKKKEMTYKAILELIVSDIDYLLKSEPYIWGVSFKLSNNDMNTINQKKMKFTIY